jgi:flagella synthesis protein FlgN
MRPDGAALARSLHIEIAALTAFVALLREEQQTLVGGKLEALFSYADAKTARMLDLARAGEQRLRWLRERGLTADRAGMERLLVEEAGDAPQAREAWRQLLALTATAQQLNTTNGTLIGSRLNGAQRALAVLFSAAKIGGAYTADGSTVCWRPAREFAVA